MTVKGVAMPGQGMKSDKKPITRRGSGMLVTAKTALFVKRSHWLMNLVIGGDWGGRKGIDEAIFSVEYRVDYVRVWQRRGKA